MLAVGIATFHFLSLSLKIKETDDYMQTLTAKASYTGPVGSLLRLFMLRDSEIAQLVCFIVFFFLLVNLKRRQRDFSSQGSDVSGAVFIVFNTLTGIKNPTSITPSMHVGVSAEKHRVFFMSRKRSITDV